ncbi:DNA/RNA non-specific endonuclease [Flavobacterium phragmitis]|uniref:Fibronectin type III domain-containing protein n=1 Tax=Flavobacterium phragmitis TaxID=739143 RepID=A0A1I1M0W7_9FLAO|nr:DNA/RNA non-specific endonuclease [Flavobacterium phragmitis]SFC79014.1 Fibronectin type III domain-containing protein [Flavobacterium phragmitis]
MLKKLQFQLFLTLGFWLSAIVSGIAQTYPVTISTQITQPSPIYLSNYADASTINSPIKVQIALNDLTISNRQIRLKCYFQGQSISLMTNDFVVGAHDLFLEGGVPLQLTNVDLAPYFQYQNLLGINPNQYAQALPEGIYTFSVEVYDFATNKKLSKKTSVTTVVFQNDPPFLNLPLNNASIMQQNIQNIIFSWTPRQINVSNVEYEFSLVEIWDKYTPIQNAFAYSPPLFTTTTRSTTLQYGVSEPQLIPGKRYAWRVKAKALLGAEEVGVFKNNGFSEIYSFDYEVFCTAPLAINVEGISENQAKVTWSGNLDNFDYQVNYREKNADSEWYKIVTPRESVTISNLKPNTTYEYTVGASCDVGKYTHSTVKEFQTLVRDEIAFQGCGIKPDPADLANTSPLATLFPNDVIAAGDFPVVVLHATGSNGTFSGDGYVTFPFLEKFRKLIDAADALAGKDEKGESKGSIGENTRIRITFNNIGLNTDFKLISGEIIASYDAEWKGMVDGDQILTDVFGSDGKPVEGTLDYVVKSATLNPDGTVTIKGENGAVTTLAKSPYEQVFTDKEGKTVTIPANGKGEPTISQGAEGGKAVASNTNGVSSSGEVTQVSSKDAVIKFSNSLTETVSNKYAYDKMPANGAPKILQTYETIPMAAGGNYNVDYKAVSDLFSKHQEVVYAEATFKNGKSQKDIIFKTSAGEKVDFEWKNETQAEIKLTKKFEFGKYSIIATVKGKEEKNPQDSTKTIQGKSEIAGKINVWDLTKKTPISVTLLGINGVKTPDNTEAEKFLNEVYNKAGISFTVTSQNVQISDLPSEIECGDSDLFNFYTDGQIDIITQIEDNNDFKYNEKTYYVLYTGKPGSEAYDGFMPLGGQYAFVFNSGDLKTAAHELGHGIFGLKHPFSTNAESDKTNLLMDYGNGTVLSHNDWDIIHSGGWKFYGFQKSSAGALAGGYGISPNFEFVKTKLTSVYSGDYIAEDGFTSGFSDLFNGEIVNYVWDDKEQKYVYIHTVNGVEKREIHAVTKTVTGNPWIWLFANNKGECNVDKKYIRTKYDYIKSFMSSGNISGLQQYIKTIVEDKSKKEGLKDSRTQVWGILDCSSDNGVKGGTGNGEYTNYVVNLGRNANKKYTEDKTDVNTKEAHLFDFATVISDTEKQKILSQLVGIKENTKTLCKIYLVDSKTPEAKKTEINNYLSSLKGKEIGLLIDFTNASDPSIKTFLGDGIEGKGTPEMNKYLKALIDILPKFEGTYTPFNPLTAMLDGLAGIIGEAKIPIRFYNPDDKDYNPIPAQVYSYITFSVVKDKMNNFITNNDKDVVKYSESRCGFAFTCGIWNGLVGAVGGIPEGASMVIKLITNEDNQAVKLWDGLTKLSWSTIGDLAGEQWDKYSANACMASYATGEVGFVVISCFYGAGEAKGLATFFQTLDRLDAIGAIMGKFAKISSPFIKAGVDKFGKFVITPLAKLEPGISKKVREALAANFNKLLKSSDQLSLSLHATDNGKFIVDGVEHSPEELGDLLSKKLSKKKEIILLSCNDLGSAKALSEATGKVVYTTDGAITAYEKGIRRAEGTKWYRVEPNGTATKVDTPPVNECPTCDGPDGVEMGKSFSGNLDKEVLEELDKVLGAKKLAELLEITKQLPSTWSIKKLDGKLILVDNKGKRWAEILDNEIHAISGDKGQGWNKFLNVAPPLMKKFKYVVDNAKYVFETDELGRVNKAIMDDLDFASKARNEGFQQKTKNVKDGFSNDDGGHIFRNEWGGPSEQINYFSQNAVENRAGGQWYNMEKAVSDFKRANPNVKIKAEMKFNFDGNSQRPTSVDVKIYKDGNLDTELSTRYRNP